MTNEIVKIIVRDTSQVQLNDLLKFLIVVGRLCWSFKLGREESRGEAGSKKGSEPRRGNNSTRYTIH